MVRSLLRLIHDASNASEGSCISLCRGNSAASVARTHDCRSLTGTIDPAASNVVKIVEFTAFILVSKHERTEQTKAFSWRNAKAEILDSYFSSVINLRETCTCIVHTQGTRSTVHLYLHAPQLTSKWQNGVSMYWYCHNLTPYPRCPRHMVSSNERHLISRFIIHVFYSV